MSEPNPAPTPTAPVTEAPQPTPTPEPAPAVDDLTAIKALVDELGIAPGQLKGRLEASRKWETRAKENADKAAEYDKFVESQKTEQQKLADAKAAAEKLAADTAAELARERAARRFGLNDDDLAALEGIPADKVDAVAERIAARNTPIPKAPPATGQGSTGAPITGGKDQLTQADVDRMFAERRYDEIETARADGRLANVLGATT